MSGRRDADDHRVTAVFVALHVGVACAISIAALAMGEGFAGPPMPIDGPPHAFATATATAATPSYPSSPSTPVPSVAPGVDPRDRPPPWRIDADGYLRFTDR